MNAANQSDRYLPMQLGTHAGNNAGSRPSSMVSDRCPSS